MFTLAHLSDLHMASRPAGLQVVGKRGLGLINWKRKREQIHRPEVLDAVTRDLAASPFDHIVVSGDLVNFSLPEEYRWAQAWLEKVGNPRNVTVVPGNHDAYIRGVEAYAAEYWGAYMTGDDGLQRFPFLRRRGDVALIALSSGVPTGPFMATGRLGERQLARLGEILDQTRDLFRIVVIHHPPRSAFKRHLRRLTDGARLRSLLASKGAELLLHGHDHQRAVVWLDGPGSKIAAVGAPSASAISRHGDEDEAGYNIFRITGNGASEPWHCEMTGRHRNADGSFGDIGSQKLL
jgi:3',5'-cyclic AMP phosphodiesterase CpdA